MDHVINHGVILREAANIQPNLSRYTLVSIIRTVLLFTLRFVVLPYSNEKQTYTENCFVIYLRKPRKVFALRN